MSIQGPNPKKATARSLFRGDVRLRAEMMLLVFLSACDLFMTYILLRQGRHFYESNPIANWFFLQWNVAGLTGFKFGLVGLIVVLGETIEHHRPNVGRAILLLGSLGALLAVVQGLRLLLLHG